MNSFFNTSNLTISGVTISYDESTSYLTLNGTPTTSLSDISLNSLMSFVEGEQYKISLTYISGSFTSNDNYAFATEIKNGSSQLSTRNYVDVLFPSSGTNSKILTVSDVASSDGTTLVNWIWVNSSGALIFDNYVVKVVVTKVETENITLGDYYWLPSDPVRTGYTFDGWYTEPNGGGTKITSDTIMNTASDHTLYAHWQINTYTVITNYYYYYYQNTTWTNFDTRIDYVTYGSSFAPYNVTAPSGYYAVNNFVFFDSSGNAIGSGTVGSNYITADQNLIVNVHYYPNTYTISYDANGGSGAPAAQTKSYGTNLTLSTTVPTRDGYTFLGWSTDSAATSATYQAGGTYTANAAATLYAVWEEVSSDSGNSDDNSGTSTGTSTVIEWNSSNYRSVISPYNASNSENYEVYDENDIYFYLSSSTSEGYLFAGAYTRQTYDLTDIDRISMTIREDSTFSGDHSGVFLGLVDTSENEVDASYVYLEDEYEGCIGKVISLDVSEFTGSYYIEFGTYVNNSGGDNPVSSVVMYDLTLTSYGDPTEISWNSSNSSSLFTTYYEGISSSYITPVVGTNTVQFKARPSSTNWVLGDIGWSTNNTYDLTNVDMITIEPDFDNSTYHYNEDGELGYYMFISKNASSNVTRIKYGCDWSYSENDCTIALDVSDLTGSYSIGIGVYGYNGSSSGNYLYLQYQGPIKLYGS